MCEVVLSVCPADFGVLSAESAKFLSIAQIRILLDDFVRPVLAEDGASFVFKPPEEMNVLDNEELPREDAPGGAIAVFAVRHLKPEFVVKGHAFIDDTGIPKISHDLESYLLHGLAGSSGSLACLRHFGCVKSQSFVLKANLLC